MEDGLARYSIGWIAPLPLELTAARAMLDEDHGDIHVDGYIYHGGKIGEHNVVMAVQPRMGTDAASDLAARVHAAFKNIEYFVVVGIGGGVPSYGPSGAQYQIVLGDVVVSSPQGQYGGVIQYDFGASTDEGFVMSGHTNGSPNQLRTAVNALRARHLTKYGTKIPDFLQKMRSNIHIDEHEKFEDQGAACDKLFQNSYLHPKESVNEDCEACCERSQSKLRQYRDNGAERQQDTPKIHYGNIASSNQLQISAAKRDQLHEEYGVICFEMEGAGVINNHPCLVIRGICDYSDSHKNKRWQPYAAATAAAYTKELLETLPAGKSARSHSAVKNAIESKELVQERTKDQKSCLQSLAFQEMNMRGNDIKQQTSTTCSWLLKHESYKSWFIQQNGLLWIKGNPGVGKSTLVKYALHECKRQAPENHKLVIASFFFHGRGSPLQKSPLGLFRSLLFQLLDRIPELLHEFTSIFKRKRDTEGEPGTKWDWHPAELQDFLQSSVPTLSKARPIRIYIDALDECGEEVARDLVKFFQHLISEPPHTGPATLSICFSCRHYPIVALDHGLTICVEKENYDDITTHTDSELYWGNLEQTDAKRLKEEIIKSASGVFQWVVLVVPMVFEFHRDGRSIDEILTKLRDIPKQLDNLYQEILTSVKPEYRPECLQLMQWICFARRPLSILELRSAMIVDADTRYKTLSECQTSKKYAKTDEQMEKRVKSLSGGLAEIVEHDSERIAQFIHQSVNDHLITRGIRALEDSSEGSVAGRAHFRLSRSCIRYIAMKEVSSINSVEITLDIAHHRYPLLQYATTDWVLHAEKVEMEGMSQQDLLDLFGWPSNDLMEIWVKLHNSLLQHRWDKINLKSTLLHVGSRHGFTSTVAAILRKKTNVGFARKVATMLKKKTEADPKDFENRTPLSWAASSGHKTVVKLLLEKGADLESKDFKNRTPLSWAAKNGHEAVVKLLLEKGADLESKDIWSKTPLSWAARYGYEAVVKLLLDKGANLESEDKDWGQTPLSWAARYGYEAVVKLLLDKGANLESEDKDWGQTPLSRAAEKGDEAIVKLLLEKGADLESKDKYWGQTPLSRAAEKGHEAVVKLLLEKGADLEVKGHNGRTPLSWAAENGHEAVVKLLLEKGANLESKDKDWGQTPLSRAAEKGHEAIVKLLLEKGAGLESKNKHYGWTPLSRAAEKGHEAVVKLLLEKGANLESKDKEWGQKPLSWAARHGHEAVAKLLLEKGANIESKDSKYSQTPLSQAAEKGHEAVVKLLLEKGADLEVKGHNGRTPLSWAVENGNAAVVKLLLEKGADLESEDREWGQTPLSQAAEKGHEAVVKLLLEKGADLEVKGHNGRTPLSWAVENGNAAVVKLLLEKGADLESEDREWGQTPLSQAAEKGHEAVVKLLLEKGADLESKDKEGQTPLSWAAIHGHAAVVKLLLEKGADSREYYYKLNLSKGRKHLRD